VTSAVEMGGTAPAKPTPPPVTVNGGVAKPATPAPVTPRPPQIVIVNKGH
jgi:hypothetical protein